ncbi:ABC transporter substrate-binding protein [Arthrobacter sp. GCM10027362]|uniref:ABC transporter substrate-binding protein n=1 Tax=Arthrobacter sp. GCM10027362 TaxID=3273379 RepID=UPI00363BBF1B
MFIQDLRPTGPRRRITLGAMSAAVAGIFTLAGCGGGSPSSSEPGSAAAGAGKLDKVTVGVLPITDVAPMYLGERQGFFEDEGIELELQPAQGGAAIVPAVTTGEYQFGYSNAVSLLIAQDESLPIKVISNGSSSTNEPGHDTTEVAAMPDSGISGPADLAGRTVAVNALNNFADITIRNSVEQAGGDPRQVKFVEIPYPNMPAALARGDVDAAWTTEPFRTQILDAGGKIVASPMTDMAENFDSAFYFTSQQTLDRNPELVERFRTALHKSFEYASENEDQVRTIIQDYAKVTPELAEKVEMTAWRPEINLDGLKALGTAAKKYGVLENEPDYNALIVQ